MLDYQSNEINRNGLINATVAARDVVGNRVITGVFLHNGNCATFTDSKGFKYTLPEEIKLSVFEEVNLEKFVNFFDESDSHDESFEKTHTEPAIKQVSIKELFEQYKSAPIKVEDYLGKEMEITIEEIKETTYGWPDNHFIGQEGNLIIQF